MDKDTNALNWFEIPVTDMARATKFYETIFDFVMFPMDMPGFSMTGFPPQDMNKVGGALVKSEYHKPSSTGVFVYLNANPDLQLVLDRVESAGGKIMHAKTQITEDIGYMAFIIDSEGNSIALHSSN